MLSALKSLPVQSRFEHGGALDNFAASGFMKQVPPRRVTLKGNGSTVPDKRGLYETIFIANRKCRLLTCRFNRVLAGGVLTDSRRTVGSDREDRQHRYHRSH